MMKFLVKNQKIEVLEREVIASDQIAFVFGKVRVRWGLENGLQRWCSSRSAKKHTTWCLARRNNLLAACRTASRCGEDEFVWLR